jgi:hypothetical protein
MEKIDRLGWAHRRLHRLRTVPIGGHVHWLLRASLSRFRAGLSLDRVLGESQEGLERVLAMDKFEGSFRLSSLAWRDSLPTFGRPRPDRDYDSIRVGAGGRVEHWCQGGSAGLSVPAPFDWRCLTSPGLPRTPAPPRRTVRAVCPHRMCSNTECAGNPHVQFERRTEASAYGCASSDPTGPRQARGSTPTTGCRTTLPRLASPLPSFLSHPVPHHGVPAIL